MDPYAAQEPPPPRNRRGCLWGCLGTLIAVAVVVTAVFSYHAWYFYKGFNNDPRIQAVMDIVKKSNEAASVLGKNISVQGSTLQTYSYETGRGGNASYVLKVVGSQGDGEVRAELDITGSDAKVKSLILIDHDGNEHYLVGTPPPNPMMQNSI